MGDEYCEFPLLFEFWNYDAEGRHTCLGTLLTCASELASATQIKLTATPTAEANTLKNTLFVKPELSATLCSCMRDPFDTRECPVIQPAPGCRAYYEQRDPKRLTFSRSHASLTSISSDRVSERGSERNTVAPSSPALSYSTPAAGGGSSMEMRVRRASLMVATNRLSQTLRGEKGRLNTAVPRIVVRQCFLYNPKTFGARRRRLLPEDNPQTTDRKFLMDLLSDDCLPQDVVLKEVMSDGIRYLEECRRFWGERRRSERKKVAQAAEEKESKFRQEKEKNKAASGGNPLLLLDSARDFGLKPTTPSKKPNTADSSVSPERTRPSSGAGFFLTEVPSRAATATATTTVRKGKAPPGVCSPLRSARNRSPARDTACMVRDFFHQNNDTIAKEVEEAEQFLYWTTTQLNMADMAFSSAAKSRGNKSLEEELQDRMTEYNRVGRFAQELEEREKVVAKVKRKKEMRVLAQKLANDRKDIDVTQLSEPDFQVSFLKLVMEWRARVRLQAAVQAEDVIALSKAINIGRKFPNLQKDVEYCREWLDRHAKKTTMNAVSKSGQPQPLPAWDTPEQAGEENPCVLRRDLWETVGRVNHAFCSSLLRCMCDAQMKLAVPVYDPTDRGIKFRDVRGNPTLETLDSQQDPLSDIHPNMSELSLLSSSTSGPSLRKGKTYVRTGREHSMDSVPEVPSVPKPKFNPTPRSAAGKAPHSARAAVSSDRERPNGLPTLVPPLKPLPTSEERMQDLLSRYSSPRVGCGVSRLPLPPKKRKHTVKKSDWSEAEGSDANNQQSQPTPPEGTCDGAPSPRVKQQRCRGDPRSARKRPKGKKPQCPLATSSHGSRGDGNNNSYETARAGTKGCDSSGGSGGSNTGISGRGGNSGSGSGDERSGHVAVKGRPSPPRTREAAFLPEVRAPQSAPPSHRVRAQGSEETTVGPKSHDERAKTAPRQSRHPSPQRKDISRRNPYVRGKSRRENKVAYDEDGSGSDSACGGAAGVSGHDMAGDAVTHVPEDCAKFSNLNKYLMDNVKLSRGLWHIEDEVRKSKPIVEDW
eukprot:Rmarinus@m.5900